MNYHTITYPDQNNGDGLRVVLWLSGCSHHCKGCQNPQTWDKDSGILFDEKAKNELFEELNKDYISGLTLSGGDPLNEYNVRMLYLLLKEIKEKFPTKTIWLYTGYVFEDILSLKENWAFCTQTGEYRYLIITLCDVLVDGQFKEDLKDITLPWRGSSNQRVINVQESLKQNKIVLHCN